jgi:hypothetical protein
MSTGLRENRWAPRAPFLAAAAIWAALVLPAGASAAESGPSKEWKLETIRLKNGKTYRGLVWQERDGLVKFWQVILAPRQPARRLFHVLERDRVARIDRLPAPDRQLLWARIRAIDPVAQIKDQQQRLKRIGAKLVPWVENGKARGLAYASEFFELRSDAPREIILRAADRLEQIYAAYAGFLPPRRPLSATRPTTVVLLGSLTDYAAVLRSQGRTVLNPAFYDPARNEIVCGSELKRLGDALGEVRKQEEELNEQIALLKKRYKGKIPAVLRVPLLRDRKQLAEAKRRNNEVFNEASRRLFETLYHEGFHAYLENFVYAAREAPVPPWLNEGLAQIFEGAVIDAGILRVEHVDGKRLQRVGALLKTGGLVPLADLLRAGLRQFHVTHAGAQQLADRYYLTSWALAYYLLSGRKRLGDPAALDRYVTALRRGDALAAFRQLTGEPLPRFEREFHAYLRRLPRAKEE